MSNEYYSAQDPWAICTIDCFIDRKPLNIEKNEIVIYAESIIDKVFYGHR